MRKVLVLTAIAALAGCGDNIKPIIDVEPDAEIVIPDAEPEPDAFVCPAPAFGEIGGACDNDADCGTRPNSHCYLGAEGAVVFSAEGYCMDDDFTLTLGTCIADGDCATGEVCTLWMGFGGYKSCMPACSCVGNTCPTDQACLDRWPGDNTQFDKSVCVPGNAAAADGAACDGVFDCDTATSCYDDTEFPNGECQTYGCTVGTDSTCNGGHCIADPDPPITATTTCVDTCTASSECRMSDGYVCFDPDGAGTAPNYCRHPHVGDACTAAADCGGAPWTCKTGGLFVGGYCTLTGCTTPGSLEGCSDGSVCYDDPLDATNYCVDRCTNGPSTCRTGYLCTDTDPGGGTTLGCTL